MALDLWVLGFVQSDPSLDLWGLPEWLLPRALDARCAGQKRTSNVA
jgi:hypothetical protein